MNLINNSNCNLSHDKYYLGIGQTLNVPEYVASKWLKIEGVTKHYTQADIEKEKEKAVKEALKEVKEEKTKAKVNTSKKKK